MPTVILHASVLFRFVFIVTYAVTDWAFWCFISDICVLQLTEIRQRWPHFFTLSSLTAGLLVRPQPVLCKSTLKISVLSVGMVHGTLRMFCHQVKPHVLSDSFVLLFSLCCIHGACQSLWTQGPCRSLHLSMSQSVCLRLFWVLLLVQVHDNLVVLKKFGQKGQTLPLPIMWTCDRFL